MQGWGVEGWVAGGVSLSVAAVSSCRGHFPPLPPRRVAVGSYCINVPAHFAMPMVAVLSSFRGWLAGRVILPGHPKEL
jgi:hypothetical protein